MPAHKFRIGDKVQIFGDRTMLYSTGNVYEIVRSLPKIDGDEFQYRIRSANEPHDRMVRESQLRKA